MRSGNSGGATLAGLERIGAAPASMINVSPATLLMWRAQLAKVKAGTADVARIATIGDSKTAGAGAGTGPLAMDGAFARSWPSHLAQQFEGDGWAIREGFFGTTGLGSYAAISAYDPRRTGFAGWGGQVDSLGGGMLAGYQGAGVGYFQSAGPVDHVSLLVPIRPGGGVMGVAKGGEQVDIDTNGPAGFVRREIVFATKSADPIEFRGVAGEFHFAGCIAWDGSLPGIEISNLSIYGTTSVVQADATRPSSPLNALAAYAPHLGFIKLGTNDLNTGVPLPVWEANIRALVSTVLLTGSAVVVWPSVGGASPAYGSDAVRAVWRARALRIALDLGALFLDEEALLGGRAGANRSGALPDIVHAAEWAQVLEAAAHYQAVRW